MLLGCLLCNLHHQAAAAVDSGAADLGGASSSSSSSSSSEPLDELAWSWVETLSGGKNDCYSVSFHPDGRQLVSGGYDRVVRLYDAARGGAAIKTFEGHQALVSRAVFSPHVRALSGPALCTCCAPSSSNRS